MDYANPNFPMSPQSNVSAMPNMAPMAFEHKKTVHMKAYSYPPHQAHHQPIPYAYSETGAILVLFILLVIISRTWLL